MVFQPKIASSSVLTSRFSSNRVRKETAPGMMFHEFGVHQSYSFFVSTQTYRGSCLETPEIEKLGAQFMECLAELLAKRQPNLLNPTPNLVIPASPSNPYAGSKTSASRDKLPEVGGFGALSTKHANTQSRKSFSALPEETKPTFESRWEEIFPDNQIIEELTRDPTDASFLSAESVSFKDEKRDGKSLVNMLRSFNRQLKQNPAGFLRRQVTAPNIDEVLRNLNEDMDPELLKLLNEGTHKDALHVPKGAAATGRSTEHKENSRLNDSFSSQTKEVPKGAYTTTNGRNNVSKSSFQKVENSPALSSRSNAKEQIDKQKIKQEEEKNKRTATINTLQNEFDVFLKQQEERRNKLKELEAEKTKPAEPIPEKPYQAVVPQESAISIEQMSFIDTQPEPKETTVTLDQNSNNQMKPGQADSQASKVDSFGVIQLKIPSLPPPKGDKGQKTVHPPRASQEEAVSAPKLAEQVKPKDNQSSLQQIAAPNLGDGPIAAKASLTQPNIVPHPEQQQVKPAVKVVAGSQQTTTTTAQVQQPVKQEPQVNPKPKSPVSGGTRTTSVSAAVVAKQPEATKGFASTETPAVPIPKPIPIRTVPIKVLEEPLPQRPTKTSETHELTKSGILGLSNQELARQVVRNQNTSSNQKPIPLVVGFKNVPIVVPPPSLSVVSRPIQLQTGKDSPTKMGRNALQTMNMTHSGQMGNFEVQSSSTWHRQDSDPARLGSDSNLMRGLTEGPTNKQNTQISLPSHRTQSRNAKQGAAFARTTTGAFEFPQPNRQLAAESKPFGQESFFAKKQIAVSHSEKGFGVMGARVTQTQGLNKFQSQVSLGISGTPSQARGPEAVAAAQHESPSRKPAQSSNSVPAHQYQDRSKNLAQSNGPSQVLGAAPTVGYPVMIRTNTASGNGANIRSNVLANTSITEPVKVMPGSKFDSKGFDIFRNVPNAGLDPSRQFILKSSSSKPSQPSTASSAGMSAMKQREIKQKQFRAMNSQNPRLSTANTAKQVGVRGGVTPSQAGRRVPEFSPLMVSSSRKDEELRNFMDWHVGVSGSPQQPQTQAMSQKKSPLFTYTNTTGTRRTLERNIAVSASQMSLMKQS